MNQTSATGNSAMPLGDTTPLLTTMHLVVIAVLALVVLLGILYGARLKHRRQDAERQVTAHAEEAGVEPRPAARDAAPDTPGPSSPASAAPVAVAGSDAANGSVGQLKGLGPKVAARLAELGITTVGQIAALDHDAAQALDAELGPFRGRLERDRWIEQARFLAAGDRAGFEAVFGKL